MANKLYVTEYANVLGAMGTQQGEALPSPALANQVLTIGTEAHTVAFHANTKMVHLSADAACCIAVGVGATATTSTQFLPANGSVKFAVTPDMRVSCIAP